MGQIKAVLFDLDGTLVDSNDQHVAAWSEAFLQLGFCLTGEAIHAQVGKGADLLIPALIAGANDQLTKDLGDLQSEIFKAKFLGEIKPFPEAHNLLARVRCAGMSVVIASSASNDQLDHYIDLLGARDILSASTTIDDVSTSKPAPDIFQKALQRAGHAAADARAVGDSPYDVISAGKSKIRTIALRSGKFADEELLKAGAMLIYDDVSALLTEFNHWTDHT